MTTLSESKSLLTAQNQHGGGGQVQAPIFLSLHRRYHLRPSSPMAKCTAANPRGLTVSGHICFAPSRPGYSSVSSVPDALMTSMYFERDTGKTKDNLCNRIQLEGVNIPLVPIWRTDLCEDSSVLDKLVHNPLRRCIHQRGVFLQQFFEFFEQRVQRFCLWGHSQLDAMDGCKETNSRARREMEFN